MAHNLNKCRLCLKLGNFYSIFTEDNNIQLADMVMQCARVEIHMDDGLPDKICSECIQKLSSAYIFKQQCERSDQELRLHYAPLLTLSTSMQVNQGIAPENIISSQHKSPSINYGNIARVQTRAQKSRSTSISTKVCLPQSSTKKAKKSATIPLKNKSTTINKKLQIQSKKDLKSNKCNKSGGKKIHVSQTSISCSRISRVKGAPMSKSEPIANTTSKTDMIDRKYNQKCEKCNETFKLNIMLKRHLKKCSKSRTSLQEIKASPQQLVNFSCEICTAKFRTMDNLQKHMRVVHMAVLKEECHESKDETINYSVPCFYCHVPFHNYTTYCAHFNSCSRRNDTSSFECPICSRMITGRSSYFIHIKTFHFEPQEESRHEVDTKLSSYMCCFCNKTLPTPELHRRHLHEHQPIILKSEETNISECSRG